MYGDRSTTVVADEFPVDLERKRMPVVVQNLHFMPGRTLALQLPLQARSVKWQLTGNCNRADRQTNEFFRCITEHASDRRIDRGEPSVEIERGNDIVGIVHKIAVALLALQKRGLHCLA